MKCLYFLLSVLSLQGCSSLSPVVLVPGYGGSQLRAKLNKTKVVHYFCQKTSDYFDIWLNLELLIPKIIDCWVDNMRLRYDNVTRRTSDAEGVTVQVPGFGNTETVEWLDSSHAAPSRYFVDIANTLVSAGLKRNVSIRGVPFDFRRAPNDLGDYLDRLNSLIEETYEMNGQKKVVLIAHSMGCPTILYFLRKKPQAWKNKYLKSLVTLAGVYGGAAKAVRVFASGDDLSVFIIPSLAVRQEQRTFSSLAFLLPSARFWGPNEILLQTTNKTYTVANYQEFFKDIGDWEGYEMWKDTKDLISDLSEPGVELHCLHGYEVATEKYFNYSSGFPNTQPTITNGDGDGTVNIRSLRGCLKWKNSSKQKVYHAQYSKVDHLNMLRHQPVIDYIKNLVAQ